MRRGGFGAAVLALTLATGCPNPPPVPEDIFAERQGEILPSATAEQRATFERGRRVAERQWTLEAGLGPHFNLSSCAGCHERPVTGGSGPRYRNFLLVQNRQPDGVQMPTAVSGVLPHYEASEGRYTTPEDVAVAALRNAIPFFGVGLIAEIEGEVIEANADPDDRDGDGISGRVNYDQGFVGRFGRKSQTVSIEGFIRGPLFNHLGITSDPLSPERQRQLPVPSALDEDASATRSGLVTTEGDIGSVRMHQAAAPSSPITDEDDAPDPEISEDDLFDLVSFSMLLAPPAPDEPTEETEAGHTLFDEVGCGDCHRSLVSPRGTIPLYSDLLIHDMGEELDDGIVMGIARGSEFRTQPLWGLAATGPYLHDGRADTIDEAIRLHGGEAERAAIAYGGLSEGERGQVLAFLDSLGGRTQRTEGLVPPDAEIPAPGTYGGPATDMAPGDADLFARGRYLFDRDTLLVEGLGPQFNGDSCRACHFLGGVGGAGTIDVNVVRQIRVDGTASVEPEMGSFTHRFAVGPRRPTVDPEATDFELRQTPQLFGLGLVDRIPESVILGLEDPEDLDGDGIRGRAHRLDDGRLGRLGWKADIPNLREFARDALSAELGLTLPEQEGLTFGITADDDGAADPEASLEDIEALVFFMANLAPPPRTRTDAALEDAGAAVFAEVGCADCHRTLTLEDGTPVPLYSDLLLHDVFEPDAVGVPSGNAGPREMRTAPLWGLARGAPYMHDGRAATPEDAIARHHGEASRSVAAFSALAEGDRAAMLAFLRSL